MLDDCCLNSDSNLRAAKLEDSDDESDEVKKDDEDDGEEDDENEKEDELSGIGSASDPGRIVAALYPGQGAVIALPGAGSVVLELDSVGEIDDVDMNIELMVGNCIVITSEEFLNGRNLINEKSA